MGLGWVKVDALLSAHRKIMDSGELDFYQHSKVCSNTCRSTKIDLVGAKVGSEQSAERVSASPTANGNVHPLCHHLYKHGREKLMFGPPPS